MGILKTDAEQHMLVEILKMGEINFKMHVYQAEAHCGRGGRLRGRRELLQENYERLRREPRELAIIHISF